MSSVVCPLMSTGGNPVNCVRDECAWWNMYQKACCVLAMAGAIKLMQKYGPGVPPTPKRQWGGGTGGDQGEF